MEEAIQHLGAQDHDEMVAFLTRAFGESIPFDRLHPGIYQPTDAWMRCNLAIRRGGRIAAIVGVFPIDLRVGGAALRVAGIGGVAVDPDHRRQGLMCRLMDRAVTLIQDAGCHLSFLGGQRQRYRHWGWEHCGCGLNMHITPANLRHERIPADAPPLELQPVGHGSVPAMAAELAAIFHAQPLHVRRDLDTYHLFIRHADAQTLVARDAHDTIRGYLVVDAGHSSVLELAAVAPDVALQMIRLAVDRLGAAHGGLGLACLDTQPPAVVAGLAALVERVTISACGNWQVFDWPVVCAALLEQARAAQALATGTVVIGLAGRPRRLRLTVSEDAVASEWVDDPADVTVDAVTALRLLFGPLPPWRVLSLPPAASALAAWCPLPLTMPRLAWV